MTEPEKLGPYFAHVPLTCADARKINSGQVADQPKHAHVRNAGLGADTSPATNAYRARIRARNAELHEQHTQAEAQLADLETAAISDNDPSLLDELPPLPGILADAPE